MQTSCMGLAALRPFQGTEFSPITYSPTMMSHGWKSQESGMCPTMQTMQL